MPVNQSYQLCPRQIIVADQEGESLDLGNFGSIHIQRRVIKTGSGGSISIQHSASLEAGSFINLETSFSLTVESNIATHHTDFLRYVKYKADGAVDTEPIVQIDIIAKET